jgi:hypothetical protein
MVIDNTNQNFNNFGEKKRRAYNNKGPLGTWFNWVSQHTLKA